jgi:hypothetical protein
MEEPAIATLIQCHQDLLNAEPGRYAMTATVDCH